MSALLEAESTLTDRYQTTVPGPVRRALRLGKRDRLHYAIRTDGQVLLTRAPALDDDDPQLAPFLDFLARDMACHPERLHAVNPDWVQHLQALVNDVEIDLDAALPADQECPRP